MTGERKPLSSYWSPRYWPVWFGMGILRLICLLPHRLALAIGRVAGRIAHSLGGSRRAIVRRNIELCFPELSPDERNALAFDHFKALGMTLIEMGLGRWASDKQLLAITKLDGIEHVQNALDSGRGVILLSAHFTTLEIMGRVLALNMPPFDAVFRRNRSEFMTELQRTGRERSAESTIEKRDIKKMVRSLRSKRSVWYAPDQSYNRKGSEVIPFFGIPAMHATATSTLARLGNAAVVPFFPRRLRDSTYELTLLPAFEDFPSDDPVADTKRYLDLLEQHVRSCPEQYFWVHRKFKDLPSEYPDYYADLDALK
ncbi:MAG: LpxL/LpxP family Kdo(2)-lipid IV(A) lauroyl/palmitoleoyl acyltransferase [Woeseiaceae bacterium]